MRVIVFGAGDIGREYCSQATSGIEILAVADNNEKLHGTVITSGGYLVITAIQAARLRRC